MSNITKYAEELKVLIQGKEPIEGLEPDEIVEDPAALLWKSILSTF